jgi:hypothetical protein
MRVPEEPVCIDLFRQNPVFTSLYLKSPVIPFMSYRLCSDIRCKAHKNVVFTEYNITEIEKYSRLSEVSQLRYRPASLHRAYVAWRAGTKSANLAQPCRVGRAGSTLLLVPDSPFTRRLTKDFAHR